jgi:hypothetical protein
MSARSPIAIEDPDTLDAEFEPEGGDPRACPLSEDDAWGDPDSFDAVDVPEFPVEVLSPWHRDWVRAESEFTQVPPDLPANVSLAVASLAATREYRVRVIPGWEEPTALWTLVGVNVAERKTPNFSAATAPLYSWCADAADRLAPQIKDRARERRVIEEQIASAESAAAKGKSYDGREALAAARDLDELLARKPEITAPRLVTDDITPEALGKLLSENDEAIGNFSAEGGAFEVLAGRYTDAPNIELWLKCHSGDPHIVDRVRRPPIILESPLLVVGITCQPSVIRGLASKPTFRGRGLLARYLYALPRTSVGSRKVDAAQVPPAVREAYHAAVIKLLDAHKSGSTGRLLLTLDDVADRQRADYQGRLEPRLGPDGDLATLADWAGKLTGTVCRIAGVLHITDNAFDLERMPAEIPLTTFVRAEAIGDYYLQHACAAFVSMGLDEATDLAREIWAWARRRGLREFTARDAQRAKRRTAEEVGPALAILVDRHLVRELPLPTRTKAGRPPSQGYLLNPRASR